MTNVRQKRKNRSGLPKAKAKRTGILKNGRKKINVLGNAIIAENWNRDLTLTQNYRKLGLVHRLNAPTGGSEKRPTKDGIEREREDSLHIKSSATAVAQKSATGEIRVERDPETGKILRVIRSGDEEIEVAGRKHKRNNPLNDPLNDLSGDEGEASAQQKKQNNDSDIVRQLELQADKESLKVAAKKPRHQSKREEEWILRLVEKHGDNYAAMARDRRLNPMQQTAGDLKRRIAKWEKSRS
ncbi:nucleolar protein 16 [Aspergillus saccharolyticus JOP 1030-1]|uniref:Nucleolar protein 16 n=1 Tax=Aspergillus saccharolyticus JOP 1030-1 TaxID=1450539 RepID=A0A318Z5C4_9EURO|nr:putative 60S ribosomal subunit biogenesis protein Nop16 [Aspergillus saccharolyticus JOP 1030-1]PYH41644.1 putative 60S ribosomal subunit biogenesis protein Nop16 [Aspergillus saccharolyticus JOP 1030-1]